MERLKNKVAIITGATKGIGEATAELFAQEGAKVVICGRSQKDGDLVAEKINAQFHDAAFFCSLEVSEEKSWEACIAKTIERFGKINIVVNNAGVSYRETVLETTADSWQNTINTNQTGVFYGIKQGIEAMKDNGESCAIVNTASVDGLVGDAAFFSYCATKAAVEAMTKCAALFCGENALPIRINAVAPGYVLTPMAYEDARQNGQTIEEYAKESIALHPIGYLGKPLDIAYAYLYLASDEASFVTGTTLAVDGGYTCR